MPATPRKPRATAKNQPQPFQQTLNPVMPVAPAIELTSISRRTAVVGLAIIGLALAAGVLGGLAIRNLTADVITVTPGSVAEVTNPQYARILQAKAIAASSTQTLQVSQGINTVQPVNSTLTIQGGNDLNQLQPVLSAYDSQGAVSGPAAN